MKIDLVKRKYDVGYIAQVSCTGNYLILDKPNNIINNNIVVTSRPQDRKGYSNYAFTRNGNEATIFFDYNLIYNIIKSNWTAGALEIKKIILDENIHK